MTFVVVDLETTGGSPASCGITEIGAVKVRGGDVLGEFHTLVNPSAPIPAFIQVLTGITDAMVAQAPRIDAVLPAFLEFAQNCVLVAHNAGFDVGFLKAAAAATHRPWPEFAVVDTVRLARQVVGRDEARDRRLATLAALFGAQTSPDHRALHDARATVDVLHALIGRVGNLGVTTLEELSSYTSSIPAARRRKRVLADGLPARPGVYVFRDAHGRALYVGTSRNIRARARSYFTSAEQRSRMTQMVALAQSIQPIVCQTALEAQVQELRLIAGAHPRFNRRSTRPNAVVWVKLTVESFPRLAMVAQVRPDGARYLGPFPSRRSAQQAIDAIHDVVPIRRCTTRLSRRGTGSACALADLGRCGAPCTGAQSVPEYAAVVETVEQFFTGDARPMVHALRTRMSVLADQQRYEDAGTVRDRLVQLVRGARRVQRSAPVAACPEIVAAKRRDEGGWELVCVRYGRLAGTSVSPPGADPLPYVASLRATAEVVAAPTPPQSATLAEETDLVVRWLEAPGVRIVDLTGSWMCPVGGAAASWAELTQPERTPLGRTG